MFGEQSTKFVEPDGKWQTLTLTALDQAPTKYQQLRFIFIPTLKGRHRISQFIEEEAEAQRSQATHPRSPSWEAAMVGFELRYF